MSWYQLENPELLDTPCLMVHPETVKENIQKMCVIAGDAKRLMPHVKTHKMEAVARLHLEHGISSFKCATIAEAEMLAKAGAEEVLIWENWNYSNVWKKDINRKLFIPKGEILFFSSSMLYR